MQMTAQRSFLELHAKITVHTKKAVVSCDASHLPRFSLICKYN